MSTVVHLNLDDALPTDLPGVQQVDAREWGPQLRFSAPARLVAEFQSAIVPQLAPFVIYGSGDFHHLSALWIAAAAAPSVVVSFDNHPDWDVRPPRWSCGSWVNRALELPQVEQVSVWGCGNFECWWPAQLFGNRRAERAGKLEVHPWADNRSPRDRQRRGAILGENWREHFGAFSQRLHGAKIYVTIDLDCLRSEDAVTSWESGRFATDDLEWALRELRAQAQIVAGDICGAFSPPIYARRKQRFASEMDHPRLARPPFAQAQRINVGTVERLLRTLAD